jgi:hypothetical protein
MHKRKRKEETIIELMLKRKRIRRKKDLLNRCTNEREKKKQ